MSEAEIRGLIAQFLHEWIKWVEAGAEEPNFLFSRSSGLCNLLTIYLRRTVRITDGNIEAVYKYFKYKLLHGDITPFNLGNQKCYQAEANDGTMHTNQQRRMWAYKTLKELQR